MGIGALNALKNRGIRVPEDVSVLGFDNIQAASFVTPALSTVAVPMDRLGETAMDTLERLLNEEEVETVQYLPVHIECRDSVGECKV